MSSYTYNFKGEYDDATFNAGPITDSVFRDQVMASVDNITHVLNYNSGIPNLSSIVTYNGNDYIISVTRC